MLRVVRTSNDVDHAGRFCSRIAKQEREVDLAALLSLLNWGLALKTTMTAIDTRWSEPAGRSGLGCR
jgi:hypothetical protein